MALIFTLVICTISTLWCYLQYFKSFRVAPIIDACPKSINFRFPDEPIQGKFLLFKTLTKVSEIEIELIGGDKSTKRIRLLRNYPTEPIILNPKVTYCYKLRSKRGLAFLWSSWSEVQTLQRQASPYSTLSERSTELCSDLRKSIESRAPCNILLLGIIGVGKSSLVNTLFTALRNTFTAPAFCGPHDRSVTTEKKDYTLILDKLNICDMPGWERDHNFSLLERIIAGECDQLSISSMQGRENQRPQVRDRTNGNNGRIGAAIVVIAANRNEETSRQVNRELFAKLKTYNLPYVTVVTKVDSLAKDNEEQITTSNFPEDPRVIRYCNGIRNTHSEHVFPLINYREETNKNDKDIDYVALQILNLALKLAQSNS